MHDCYTATAWVGENGIPLGIDPGRLGVGGDSAGGNLAAAVALMAREGGPPLKCQLLVYPALDHDAKTASLRENADPYFFNHHSVAWYWSHYLADPKDGDDPLASPLRAGDLRGLPPALVITAEFDPLRDEGELYAERLRDAGVPVERARYDGVVHGFFAMTGRLDAAKDAQLLAARWLRDALAASA